MATFDSILKKINEDTTRKKPSKEVLKLQEKIKSADKILSDLQKEYSDLVGVTYKWFK